MTARFAKHNVLMAATKQTIQKLGAEVVSGLLDLVYPPRCLVCGAWMEEGALCAECIQSFAPILPPFCDRCGGRAEAGHAVCADCKDDRPPTYAWSQALGQYGGALRHAIHRFKYEGKTALAQPLGTLLARSLDQPPSPLLTYTLGEPLTFDFVVPVPLHPSRFRQRGFNQAERLARIVAQQRGWTLETKGLLRTRRTRTQATLDKAQRGENIRGAFACRHASPFAGKSVLVIDDVLTTGSTLGEAARVIGEAGASRVCVVALARG